MRPIQIQIAWHSDDLFIERKVYKSHGKKRIKKMVSFKFAATYTFKGARDRALYERT